MEEHRCKIAATWMEDSRCQSLLVGVVVEMEDRRCKGLSLASGLEMEDSRFTKVATRMEDPRCSSLRAKW